MLKILLSIIFKIAVVFSLDNENHPVCIIGAGVTGLTLARQFKEQGLPYIVFEKETKPGGKAVTWRDPGDNFQLDMGPLFFSKNSTNSLALFSRLGFTVTAQSHWSFTAFEIGTDFTIQQPPVDVSRAQERYFKIRRENKLKPGNLNVDPSLHVSLGTWLIQNNLYELVPLSQIMVSASGYGSVFETPALYGLRILDEHGDIRDPLYTVNAGLDKVFLEYAKGLNIYYGQPVKRIYARGQVYPDAAVLFESYQGPKLEVCSKVVTAFPPLRGSLKTLTDLSPNPLLNLLKRVKVTKFATFAVINNKLQDFNYFPLLKSNPVGPRELTGDGRITGLVKQNGIYSCYIWLGGPSSTPANSTEVIEIQRQLYDDIDALVNTPLSTKIPYYRNWEYFPHVNTRSLDKNFYKRLHRLQGTKGLYIAGPLLSFETIHNSIDAAKYMFDTYLHSYLN